MVYLEDGFVVLEQEGGLFGMFKSVSDREYGSGSRCVSLWNSDSMLIFGFFEFLGVARGGDVGVVEVA